MYFLEFLHDNGIFSENLYVSVAVLIKTRVGIQMLTVNVDAENKNLHN